MSQGDPESAAWMGEAETLRARVARERDVTVRLLRVAGAATDLHDLMRETTGLLRDWFGCEAVGIRLREGDDFPYFETHGFPPEFVEAENQLCVRDLAGQLARDELGNPMLECMCGNILSGRFDPKKPFFTANGSFWTNSTTALLATTTEADRCSRTRNRCNGEGYESVALVPIRSAGKAVGLLQLNDRSVGRFVEDDILLLEHLAAALGETIARRVSERALQHSEAELRAIHDCAPVMMCVLDSDRRVLRMNRAMLGFIGQPADAAAGQRACGVLGCINALDDMRGCGYGPNCQSCALRLAMLDTFATGASHSAVEHRTRLDVGGQQRDVVLLGSTSLIQAEGQPRLLLCLDDITEREHAEQSLRDSEQRYRSLFSSMTEGFALCEAICDDAGAPADYRVLQVNPAFERLTGLPAARVLGRFVREAVARFDPRWLEEYSRVVLTGQPLKAEYYVADLRRHFRVRAFRPTFGHLAAIFEDVSERKRAEEAIRRSEARLKEAQRIAHIGSFHYDFASESVWWSDEMYRLFGVVPDAGRLTFDDVRARIHPDDLAQWDAAAREAIKEGRSVVTENRVVHPDGNIRHHYGMVHVKLGPNGHPQEISGTIQDVTDRKLSEQALRDSEAILDQAARVAGLGCVVWDLKADNMFGSRYLYSILDVAPEQSHSFRQAVEAFIHPEDRQRVLDEAQAMLASGDVRPLEIRVRRRDGQEIVFRTAGELVRDEHGELARFVGVLSDITKAKADEARFESMAQQLRHASRLAMIGELSAGIAHEVNQPLCSILNFAKACQNVLALSQPDLTKIREWINAVATAAARAGDIVRRFSGFARRSEVRLIAVSVEDLVHDSLSLVRFEAQSRKVAIQTSFADPRLRVCVHPVQVQQVLVNLLRNAIEAFNDNLDRPAQVLMAVNATNEEIHVAISDNGVGFPAGQAQAIFSPFFSTKPEGLGLGLAVSKTIVESYGGRIWAEPNAECGASFHFTLPRRIGG